MDAQANARRSARLHTREQARNCGCAGPPWIGSRGWHAFEYPETGGTEMRYAVVIEKTETGYSAYVPDLPGCIATGATVAEAEMQIREAIAFHLEGLREDGLPIPQRPAKLSISTSWPNPAFNPDAPPARLHTPSRMRAASRCCAPRGRAG